MRSLQTETSPIFICPLYLHMLSHDSAPDLVIYNGAIHTLHAALPRCAALACKHGRIVAIGEDQAVRALAGANTRQIDLARRTVVPGFNDAHNHMLEVGIKFTRLQVENCASIVALVALVRPGAGRSEAGGEAHGTPAKDGRRGCRRHADRTGDAINEVSNSKTMVGWRLTHGANSQNQRKRITCGGAWGYKFLSV